MRVDLLKRTVRALTGPIALGNLASFILANAESLILSGGPVDLIAFAKFQGLFTALITPLFAIWMYQNVKALDASERRCREIQAQHEARYGKAA